MTGAAGVRHSNVQCLAAGNNMQEVDKSFCVIRVCVGVARF